MKNVLISFRTSTVDIKLIVYVTDHIFIEDHPSFFFVIFSCPYTFEMVCSPPFTIVDYLETYLKPGIQLNTICQR